MKLLFYKGTKKENPSSTLWDNIICFITRSRFSHVEISFYSDVYNYACWSSSTRDGGVRYTRIPNDDNHWVVVDLERVDSDEWFFQHVGKDYDYIGLIGTIIKLPFFSSKNKWFCSEIIAEYLGIKESWKITPEKLYKLFV